MTTPIVNHINFKSDAAVISPAVNYNNRYTPTMPAVSNDDTFYLQAAMEKNQNKKERNKEAWYKTSVIAQVALAASFGVMALGTLLAFFGIKKFSGSNRVNQELDALTGIKMKWEDFSKAEKKVASLDSKTTSKELKEVFNNIISSGKLTPKAKEWGGSSGDGIDIIYLYGHGGVGKTYVAKQYAQEIGAKFACIKYPDIGSPYKDAASMRINNLFDSIIEAAAKEKDKPFVVCIDEIDAVMRKVPDGQHDAGEVAKARGAVLTGLDKLREKCANVTVIATSNYHPKNGIVDPIALRRFNNKIEVKLPDSEQIPALMEMYLKNIGAISNGKFVKSSEFKDFAKTLEKEGYSNGEIELICKEAGKIFSASLKGVPDSDLASHKFSVKYLKEAMKANGEASSKTNRLMDVEKGTEKEKGKTLADLSFFQKLLLLFGKN